MKSYDYRNNPLFLRNQQYMVGSYDMPFLYAQKIDLQDIALIAFSNTRHEEASATKRERTVHFFLDDYKFDEVWNDPESQLFRLKQYKQVMSPGFSAYANMPEPLQIYNTFRNRWCASYWQFSELVVIPTIVWGGENTFAFCFDGIERGCIVAISTLGAMDDEVSFRLGYEKMCDTIQPEVVLNYGSEFGWMKETANLITIPYAHPSHEGQET
jgi:hypothetical protein